MAKDKRVEVLFDKGQYKVLEDAAHREGKSVGHMIREAVAKYISAPSQADRERALRDFLSIDGGPVGSPEEIKEEILRGYDEDDKRLYEAS